MSGIEDDIALIRALIDYAGVSAAEVARRAKVSPRTIQRMKGGNPESRLSAPTLDSLRAAYPGFPGWTRGAEWSEITPAHDRADDIVELDQIDLKYGMGGTYADGPIQIQRRAFSRGWLRSITSTAPQHLSWAVGDNDSMEPTIRSGEVVLIDRSQDSPRHDAGVWAVAYGEIGSIKRLRYLPDGTVELHSDNQLVRPQTAVDGELHVIGRVIAVVRRL